MGTQVPSRRTTRRPDHVPPKGLFDTPKPDNLITVLACHACNSRHSGFDERLRVLAASELQSNSAGKRIFMEKVIGSTMKKRRQFQFLAPIVQSFSSASVQTPHGPLPITKFRAPNPKEDVQLGVQSMVKGLLANFYPGFSYHAHHFVVMDYHTATLARPGGGAEWELLKGLLPHCIRDARGHHREFLFWRHVDLAGGCGVWFLLLYEALGFLVWHSADAKWQEFSPGQTKRPPP